MFSIIIPSKNYKNLTNFAFNSLNKQTFKKFEVIFVIYHNDYSKIKNFIFQYLNSSIDFKLILIQELNVSLSRNLGIKASKYNWICFLDDDDKWYNNKLEVICENIKKKFNFYTHDVLVVKNNKFLYQHSKKISFFFDLQNNIITNRDLLHSNVIITSSVIINKNIFMKEIFDQELFISEDYDLWQRLSAFNDIYFIDSVLAEYNKNINSQSDNIVLFEEMSFKRLYKNRDLYDENDFVTATNRIYFLIILKSMSNFNYYSLIKIFKTLIKSNKKYIFVNLVNFFINKITIYFKKN